MKHQTTVILYLLVFAFCLSTISVDDKIQQSHYSVYDAGEIDSLNWFLKLTPHELERDSSMMALVFEHESDEEINQSLWLSEELGFIPVALNRARFFSFSEVNDKLEKTNEEVRFSESGFPSGCNCRLKDDTIYVEMFRGFFGGDSHDIRITREKFSFNYSLYLDDVQHLKSSPNDPVFGSMVTVGAISQQLTLLEKPSFKECEQLTGYLHFQTERYYEGSEYSDDLDTISKKGRLFFTCTLRQGQKN